MGDKPPEHRRLSLRFDKVFPVLIKSEVFGDMPAIARNISQGGMFIEMGDPLPIATMVTVHFVDADDLGEVVVRAEVKHHYCFNYQQEDQPAQSRGIGIRFVEFVEQRDEAPHASPAAYRSLH